MENKDKPSFPGPGTITKNLSAEEILNGNTTGSYEVRLADFDDDYPQIIKSMEEYADQKKRTEAIAFAEWTYEEGYLFNNGYWWMDSAYFTPEELYKLFLKSHQQKEG